MYKKIITWLFFFLILTGMQVATAQRVYTEQSPAGINGFDLVDQWYEIAFDNRLLDSLEKLPAPVRTPMRFAIKEEMSLSPENSGFNVNKGDKTVWYLPVRSHRAKSLNVIFSSFRLVEGEMLFIYDINGELVRGPFTCMNNNSNNVLATLPVPGEELIIEYHRSVTNPGIAVVGQVSHDYLGILEGIFNKDIYFGSSGACNVDINCPLGEDWQVEKRAVVRILAAGTDLGSGALVNNTSQQNLPYLLTADHLIGSQTVASASIFVFNYESAWCDGEDTPSDRSISGSSMVANNSDIDLTLLKLTSFPPITYKPYLAGWDARTVYAQNTTTIHHPSGDVKKISVDLNPPVVSTYPEMYSGGFWKVLQWEYGTTEGGSSGAPLFNQEHHIIGHLTGGSAECGNSVNDYFARFDIAYDLSPDMSRSLKDWLDPAQSGFRVLNGRDPYAPNFILSDTLSNTGTGDTLLTEYDIPLTGYTTGFNSDSLLAYAESFSYTATGYVTEVFASTGDTRYLQAGDHITFYIYENNGGVPGTVLGTRDVLIKQTRDTFLLSVVFKEPVEVTGDFFAGYRLWYTNRANTGSQQFSVFHSNVVPPEENSGFFLSQDGWHPFTEHPYDAAGRHLFLSAVVVRDGLYNSLAGTVYSKNSWVYPNPFNDNITIKADIPGGTKVDISLIDMQGRTINRYALFYQEPLNIGGIGYLDPGLYILQLSAPGWFEVHRIIKSR